MKRATIGIVGAGAVGMYTALRLVQEGHRVHIWDRRTTLRAHSRSIGIHPPAWKLLAQAGLEAELAARAQVIREGQAWWNGRPVGTLDMTGLDGPLASLAQHETEAMLQAALMAADPDALRLGVRVVAARETDAGVEVRTEPAEDDGAGSAEPVAEGRTAPDTTRSTPTGNTMRVDMLLGCDGKESVVREAMESRWEGRSYGIPYLMGDFPDTVWPYDGPPPGDSAWRHAAVIMLGARGLVESFPLPGGARRWVVRLPSCSASPGTEHVRLLVEIIRERTGWSLAAEDCLMVSAFGVERREARPMARGRMVLLGDAAHIVSPIGGQGMNLGWIEAEALVQQIRREGIPNGGAATRPGSARRFRAAARRAEFNMWMGAPCSFGGAAARRALVRALTLPVIRDIFVRRFTMHGL